MTATLRAQGATFLLLSAVSATAIGTAQAQSVSVGDFEALRSQMLKQQQEIDSQARMLKSQQREIQRLRNATTPGKSSTQQPQSRLETAPRPSPAPIAAGAGTAAAAAEAPANASASIAANPAGEAQRQRQQESRIVQSNLGLSRSSGVLTPKGSISIEPSLEYDDQTQRQAVVSGFTIIPGITFGNINIAKTQQNTLTAATTLRVGVTDRLELNMRIPFVYSTGSTTTGNVGQSAQPITATATGHALGDIELGGSYQINSGNDGWPVFVGNLRFKTITGRDPFSVPIFTINDANGAFLRGVQKELPTGTGFYTVEPSMTVLYPSDPVILFGNFRYIHNIGRTVNVQNDSGGPPTPTYLHPGDGIGANFGFGFALNEKASLSLSYEEVHVFNSSSSHLAIGGSGYDLGTFNFGLGYQLTDKVSINLGAGIGVTPDTPAAKILLSVPIKLPVF